MQIPKWHRADPNIDRLNNHMQAEGVYQREIGDVTQVIERCMLKDRPTQDARPLYRLVEVKDGKARAIHTAELRAAWTMREVRAAADKRASRKLAAMREP